MGEKNTPGCAKRFEPAPWCTGTRRAGSKMGGREDGLGGYLWSFSAPKVRYFLYRPSRGSQVVEEVVEEVEEEVLGEEFDGVVVSDFYGAYNGAIQRAASRAASEMLDSSVAGHPPFEGATPEEPGPDQVGPRGAGSI